MLLLIALSRSKVLAALDGYLLWRLLRRSGTLNVGDRLRWGLIPDGLGGHLLGSNLQFISSISFITLERSCLRLIELERYFAVEYLMMMMMMMVLVRDGGGYGLLISE